MSKKWKKYLLWFAQEHVDFRFAEMESLLSMFRIEMNRPVDYQNADKLAPYWIVELQNDEEAKLLVNRTVSIRSCIELWGHATSKELLHSQLKSNSMDMIGKMIGPDVSFKIEVETYGKHLSQEEKINKVETFSYLPVEGPVKLKNPDVCLSYIEYYGTDANNPPEHPYFVFFGKWITNGLRQLIQKLSLKTRKFIGNTTMDPQLSLLMANQAQITNGDLVLDPFVGSGSLLVAAAEFGGYVTGADIDYLMLHAKTRPSRITQKVRENDESIKANMVQYNLQHRYIDILINDFSVCFWKDETEFDAIITDPPYGIREATERVGTNKGNYKISAKHLPTHIPAKIEYGISNIYRDLLNFAAKHLKIGRRLVCWFPVFREDYKESGLPSHPSLKLIANSEQILSKATSRRLLTFEKIQNLNVGSIGTENVIADFREKYFVAREETRRERRTRDAKIRNENWMKSGKNLD